MISYDELKNGLLNIKKRIDEEIKEKGITPNLINYEENLNKIYKKVKKVWGNEQNKEYINFNYFPCKAVISLAKGHHYSALKEWLEGFKNFIEYTNEVKDASKWLGSIDYYRSRYSYISEKRVEIFGSLPLVKFNEIITAFENVINAISPTNSLSIKIQETLIDAIDSIITNSTEIYTDEHLRRKNVLIDLLKKFDNKNNYIVGMKCRIEFILLKKEFHYYIRKNLKKKDFDKSYLEKMINQMKVVAGKEKNNFNKINDGEELLFKKFLSKIDALTSDYYYILWIKKDLIQALKCLTEIFSDIKKHIDIIKSSSMFQYFVNEFLFLHNYIKLLLVANDFKNFANKKNVYDWQKKLSDKIYNYLINIAEKEFKYMIPENIQKSLLIVEKSTAGKFLEFIIFYFLKELLNNKEVVLQKLHEIKDDDIKKFLKSILNYEPHEIKWGQKISTGDIDISVSDSYAIFIKSGIIGKKDKKNIKKELENAKSYYIFYFFDTGKNVYLVKEVEKFCAKII